MPLAVCIFVLSTLASFRVRHSEDLFVQGGFDWQVKFQAASWVVLGVLAALLVLTGRADLQLLRRGPLYWFCALTVVALLSSALAPSPLLTAFRSVQLGIAAVLVISLGRRLEWLYLFLCVFLAINWIVFGLGALGIGTHLTWIRPPHELFEFHAGSRDDVWRFCTAFGHPSQISIVAAVVAVGLAARARGRAWLIFGPVIAWCVLTNLMTISRTGIAGMLLGFAVVAWDRRKLLPLTLLAGIGLPLLLWSERAQDSIIRYIARGQNQKEFATLTGRDTVFAEAWRRSVETSFIGEGFATGRTRLLAKSWGASHAHNLFLQAITALGLPGLIIVTLVIVTFLREIWRLRRTETPEATDGREFTAIAAPLLTFCLMDSGFVGAVDPFVLMFLLLAARLSQLLARNEPALAAAGRQQPGCSQAVGLLDVSGRPAPSSPLFTLPAAATARGPLVPLASTSL
jgi:hypothetical protein